MSTGALDGVRVVDLSVVWAGPYTGRLLSEMGAEVIHISSHVRALEQRKTSGERLKLMQADREKKLAEGVPEDQLPKVTRVRNTYGINYQTNKYSIGLDLTNPKGKEVFKKLVKASDVVLENFSARVMKNLGLDYEALKEVKPDIIMISEPGLGKTGPEKDFVSYGTTIEWLTGVTSMTGYPDGEPHRAGVYLADGPAGVHGVVAILAALNYHRETGKGQFIDLAQTESMSCLIGEAIMDYSMNKRNTQPMGNRHPSYAPHGCYRCKGDDMWVTIAVASDEEWHCFCDAIGNPEWTKDDKFSDVLSRWNNQGELNKLIEQWTIQHDHYAVQEILQSAGVAAGAVVTLEENIMYDPQIQDRDVYQYITYHDGLVDPIFRMPWIFSKTPGRLTRPAPYVGQHSDYVFGEILGMSKKEIAKLTEEKAIGSVPPLP